MYFAASSDAAGVDGGLIIALTLSQLARRARFLDFCDVIIARVERKANQLVAERAWYVSDVADRVDMAGFEVPLCRFYLLGRGFHSPILHATSHGIDGRFPRHHAP